MRIAYCILGTFNAGGMERVLSSKTNYFVNNLGWDVFVITTDQKDRPSFFEFSPKIKHIDLNVNYTDEYKYSLLYRKLLSGKKRLHEKRLSVLLQQLKCDIVISMYDQDFYFLNRIKDGSAKVLEFHFSKYARLPKEGDRWRKILTKYYILRDSYIINKYSKFVVLTEEDRTCWGDFKNMTVIHNALVDIPNVHALLNNKQVLSIGRLVSQKGYDRLIRAWKLVHDRYSDWKLKIIGGGEDHDKLLSLIERLELLNIIEISPPTSTIEKDYLESSVFVLSSRYEGLPMVLIEAMGYGIPCVAFSCQCGPSDIIENKKTGLLVENGNVDELANAICCLLGNQKVRIEMGKKGAISVKEKYDFDCIMKQWVSLFHSIV